MFDPTKFSWLDQGIFLPEGADEKEAELLLNFIDKKEWTSAKKNLVGRYYLEHLSNLYKEGRLSSWKLSNDLNKEVRAWQKTNAFKRLKETSIKQDKNKFLIAGMMTVMTGTILLYFLTAIVTQKFVLMFSVDAIVASVALVLLIRNLILKYKMVTRYVKKTVYMEMDVVSLVLCICLKLVLPSFLDLSLVVLFSVHFMQKKRFEKALNSII